MANFSKVFTKFRDPVNSKPLGEMNIGMMKPGRYSGFDIMQENIGLNVKILHSNTINKASEQIDDVITMVNFGNIVTPNGSIIHNEDTDSTGLDFTLDTNVANSNVRYDFLICEHSYVRVVGGVPPTYFVQKGPLDGNHPEVANPEKQTVVGIFTLQAGAYNYSGISWEKSKVPLLGDMEPQDIVDYIIDIIQVGSATTEVQGIIELADAAELAARTDGEKAVTPAGTLLLVPTEALPGTTRRATDNEVINNTPTPGNPYLTFVSPDQLRKFGRLRDVIEHTGNSVNLDPAWNGKVVVIVGDGGTSPLITITIPNTGIPKNFWARFITVTQNVRFLTAGGITVLIPVDRLKESRALGVSLDLECVKDDSTLFTLNGDLKIQALTNSSGLVPMLAAIPYFPDSNDLSEFDASGLGIAGEVIGWAICNGANGTRNLTGRFLRQLDPTDASCNSVGDEGGFKDAVVVAHTHTLNNILRHTNSGGTSGLFDQATGGPASGLSTDSTGESGVGKNIPPFYTTIYIQRIS